MSFPQDEDDNILVDQQPVVLAQIFIAPVTMNQPGSAQYKNQFEDKSIFTDYVINNRFEKDKHIYMMGVSSPTPFQGASVAFCQLASPTLLWIADWTGAKFASMPPIPNSTPTDPNWILLDEHYEPSMVTVGPDGVTPLYRISGTYFYGHRNPSKATIENINFGRPPWLEDVFDLSITAAKLEQGLINKPPMGATPVGPSNAAPVPTP